jgi:DTW domain-containing protein
MSRELCADCHRPVGYCYCADIVRLQNHWPVHILQDQREASHPLGTARMAALSLQNCQLHTQTLDTKKSDNLPELPPLAADSVLIYPSVTAGPITELKGSGIRPLIFLDASWRRSRKMLHVWPQLSELPHYALHTPPAGRYRIRKAPSAGALSTLEAIALTLAVLEEGSEPFVAMLDAMDRMIDRQIQRMGAHTYHHNYLKKDH